MAGLPLLGAAALSLVTLFADVAASAPEPLDRVVGVVGEKPIFLSELRKRVAPHFYRIDYMGGPAADRAAMKTKVMREVVERMIDELLEAREAEKLHITADSSEIEAGMDAVAKQAKIARADLLAEAKKQGYPESEYRAEIARQIIEGKLMQLRVRPRVRVSDADQRAVYATWAKEQAGPDAPIDVRFIVLNVAKDATDASKKTTEALAKQIIGQARSGTDFCSLVTKHSQDSATKSACGSRGKMPRSSLLADIAKATSTLKPGETAPDPLLFTDPAGSTAYLVLQVAPGTITAVPPFDVVKDRMKERAELEAVERERKKWVADLRKGVYVEVKL